MAALATANSSLARTAEARDWPHHNPMDHQGSQKVTAQQKVLQGCGQEGGKDGQPGWRRLFKEVVYHPLVQVVAHVVG